MPNLIYFTSLVGCHFSKNSTRSRNVYLGPKNLNHNYTYQGRQITLLSVLPNSRNIVKTTKLDQSLSINKPRPNFRSRNLNLGLQNLNYTTKFVLLFQVERHFSKVENPCSRLANCEFQLHFRCTSEISFQKWFQNNLKLKWRSCQKSV